MKKNLTDLKIGQSGIVLELNVNQANIKRHLLEMGLTKGTNIKLKKIAPTGDNFSIELRGYELCISKDEAKKIVVD